MHIFPNQNKIRILRLFTFCDWLNKLKKVADNIRQEFPFILKNHDEQGLGKQYRLFWVPAG
jgi:hypothetical protein